MTALPLHLLGLAIVAYWLWVRPHPSLKALFGLWWLGLILIRVGPVLFRALVLGSLHPIDPSATALFVNALIPWIGSLLLLRALLGLMLWERPRRRRLWAWVVLFALGLILYAFQPAESPASPVIVLYVLIALPMLLSFRWQNRVGLGGLLLTNAGALLSMLVLLVGVSGPLDGGSGILSGLGPLPKEMWALALIYTVFSFPATARRFRLPIRRISRRLVCSHLLAGLMPIALAVLFLLLSGALFLSAYRSSMGVRALEDISNEARRVLGQHLAATGRLPRTPFGPAPAGQLLFVREGSEPVQVFGGEARFPPDSLLAAEESSHETPLLWDGKDLYVRARLDTLRNGHPLRAEALAPVDAMRMGRISRIVGVPVWVRPQFVIERQGGGLQMSSEAEEDSSGQGDSTRAGSIGPANALDRDLPGGATVFCLKMRDGRWVRTVTLVSSSAGFGEQVLALLSIARENPIATVALAFLGLIAFFFLIAICATTSMVYAMARSIASAVRALTGATTALREGKLDHRIALEGKDELWAVAASFNEMAEGLEKMREMELEAQRIEEELRLAREIQTRLLPAEPPAIEGVELAGLSLPAREVGGDYFDYPVTPDGHLALVIADVSGKGMPAALLMSAFRASLRSQDLATLGPAKSLARINQFIHASVEPGKFITAFLGLLNPATGEFRYASAGHDPPIIVQSDGSLEELSGGGLILGLMGETTYSEATVELVPGALLVAFTDGVTEAQNPEGSFFETQGLSHVLKASLGQSCAQIQSRIIDEIRAFSSSAPQSDDITLLLARRG